MALESTAAAVQQEVIDGLGLRRISTKELTIERVPADGGFAFRRDGAGPVGWADRRRIAELVIPPAWNEVRIAADADAHLQAVGRDAAGRLQYIYHSAWEDVRAATKHHRLLRLGERLARLRGTIARDLAQDSPTLALAAAARLVDRLHLRAGHESYAGPEGGRGAATLLKRHVRIDGSTFRLRFRGKGGKIVHKTCTDEALAGALAELYRNRGPRLFKLKCDDGYRPMTASDLNGYLAAASGGEVTAKDFRTLYASSAALDLLSHCGLPSSIRQCRREIAEASRRISVELVNTPSVVRKSYIHPLILEKFEGGELTATTQTQDRRRLTQSETRLFAALARWSANAKPLPLE